MLIMSIPIITPIDLSPAGSAAKLLPAPDDGKVEGSASPDDPDYKVETNEPKVPPPPLFIASPALMAVNELEHAIEVNAHHDFGWWRERINMIRDALRPKRPTDDRTS